MMKLAIILMLIGHHSSNAMTRACSRGSADIFFLLDSSSSEGTTNFRKQLEFVNAVANEFDFGPNLTHIGLGTFGTGATLEIPITRYHTKEEFMQNVLKVPFKAGESNLHLGLDMARFELLHHTSTAISHRFLIIVTDGRSPEHEWTVDEANRLHLAGVETFVVGIGNDVDGRELLDVASDRVHVFRLNSSIQLDTIHQTIVDRICAVFHRIITSTTTQKPTITTKPYCGSKVADILFILDSSDSEGTENFKKILDFVYNFARLFAFGVNNVLFSLITYSSSVNVRFHFNTYTSSNDVLRAIQNTSYIGLGTNTYYALNVARTQIFRPEYGSRQNATNIAIVITDGKSMNPAATLLEAAQLRKVADVYSIGIGASVDQHELAAIASRPSNVMQVNSFELLHTIQEKLAHGTCT